MDTRTFDAANPRGPTPTSDDELARLRFRDAVTQECLLRNVRPAAIRHVVRDASDYFALQDNNLVSRNGAVDPNDPLVPLSFGRWLEQLRRAEPNLFVGDAGRAH
jgi:hypothetical protein